MDYSTFHGANSTNTFNILVNSYVAEQIENFDEEIFEIFTKEREIEENEVTLAYPKGIFNNPINEGHKIAAIDIHSYNNLKQYYFKECLDEVAFTSQIPALLQSAYINIASKNILTIETIMSNVLEQVFNILSIKTKGILFGIILHIDGKNYNLTHPSVLQLLLDEYDWKNDSHHKCTLYIYINENEDNCKTLRDLNEESYFSFVDKKAYLEILKKNILFSCALTKSKITKSQKIKVDSSILVDYSAQDIFITRAEHSPFLFNKNILKLYMEGYLPNEVFFPDEEDLIDIPYYVPIDILAKGVFVPYYGGAILHARLNIYTGTCSTEYLAMNVSPFKSANIYINSTSIKEFTTVCTGNLKEYDLETICSINYLNANSPYHYDTIAPGFLDAIKLNIEIAHSILANYLRKDINDSNKNNSNESSSRNTSTTQEGSDTNLQSASNRDISMETKMAQSNNPFERDISYKQRISSSHVEPSIS